MLKYYYHAVLKSFKKQLIRVFLVKKNVTWYP